LKKRLHPSFPPLSYPRQAWTAAVITAVALVSLFLLPAYRDPLIVGWNQARLLPGWLDMSLHEIRLKTMKEPYGVVAMARDRTFEDAVLVVTDDPADEPLSSVPWCAYYLYPRVLVPAGAWERMDINGDFAIYTRRFRPPGAGHAASGLVVLSDRARSYAQERWPP
jgi:hypothetical protein